MVRVRWEDLERTPLYEDMVSVLLSRLHPDAERIDGIGGTVAETCRSAHRSSWISSS
jgi:hypothetical protein